VRPLFTAARLGTSVLIAFSAFAVAAGCHGQTASPPVLDEPAAIQEAPGEGDAGQSEDVDEAADTEPYDGPYRSPDKLTFKAPLHELLFDADQPRGSVARQSTVPSGEWYTAKVRREWGSWGVPARAFDCPPRVREKPAEWRRERVVAAAVRFIGYQYQHHHVPDWHPPGDWPWKRCCAGHNGKGIDCSNFSGWNYNWALGIHLNTDVHKQAAARSARASGGEAHAQVIHRPAGDNREWYEALVRELRAGDLLYIRNKSRTKVSHVIMWVGECGSSPDGTPLVIDSTGGRVKDSNGHAIPCGIHLRPFKKGGWYHEAFAHAHRWVK
jgi:cell wall-associated NlpC family hydrolase